MLTDRLQKVHELATLKGIVTHFLNASTLMSQPQHCQPFKKLPKEVREDTILYHGSLQRHDSNEDLLDNFFGFLTTGPCTPFDGNFMWCIFH